MTVHINISPRPAEGRRLRRPLIPLTEMRYRFLAPELSAQLIVAPTGRASVTRNLPPDCPVAKGKEQISRNKGNQGLSEQKKPSH